MSSTTVPNSPVEVFPVERIDSQASCLRIDSRLSGTQKICDIVDWFDPGVDHIIREHLRSVPNHQRRQWEFAMIFLSLARAGALRPDARAMSYGSGTEVLIYTIARLIGHLTVTDLYNMSSRWVGVRTTNPREHVLAHAPFEIDASKIDARDMDMRHIDAPDNSVDFCWSTGSFEHIGDDADFVRHLSEVHRTLKEGGVYAFTTVACFEEQSSRIPHNHYFSVPHLLDLIDASPLRPDPVMDCRLTPMRLNQPVPDRLIDFGLRAGNLFTPVVTLLRRGLVTSAIALVLRKNSAQPKARPTIIGLDETTQFLQRALGMLTAHTWRGWQQLDPLTGITVAKQPAGENALNERGQLLFRTQPQYFGQNHVQWKVEFDVVGEPAGNVHLEIAEQNRIWPLDKRVAAKQIVKLKGDATPQTLHLEVASDERKCYSLQARVSRGAVRYRSVRVFATIDASAPAAPAAMSCDD